jgi:hypothetical protein
LPGDLLSLRLDPLRLCPGSAHHPDPRAAPPATRRSQPEIIQEITLSHHGNTAPEAEM